MTANDTGVFVHRGKDVITINHEEGIRAPDHTIEAANMQSEYNVATNHDVNAANIIKAPQLRTTRIKLYADGHTHLKIEAPIVLENGGINVSNVDSATITSQNLNMKKGDLACRNFYASGTCVMGTFEKESRSHEGKHMHFNSLTINDDSIYIGLMRRSYDRATHKPVTHILKRQIPAYLVAAGFALGDIPAPFTVGNMTVNNWVTLAQDFENDTTIEVDTVFPAATTADWEDYIDPISVDLDAAELEIDDHETRIVALEGAGSGELGSTTLYTASTNSEHIQIGVGVVGLVIIAHDNLSGVTVSLPAMSDGDVILVKNLNLADGGDESIELLAYNTGTPPTPEALFDGRWDSIQLNASSNANNSVDTYTNQCARLMYLRIYAGLPDDQYIYCRLNDSY